MSNSSKFVIGLSVGLLALGALSFARTANAAEGVEADPVGDNTTAKVVSVDPADLSKNVPINQKITVVFNHKMDPKSFTADTFTVKDLDNRLPGEVSCTGTTAKFIPSTNLPLNTVLTCRIAKGVKDFSGTVLVADYVWTFQTSVDVALNQKAIELGTASNFVILARQGISTTGTTMIHGDVGLSPGVEKALVGFSTVIDSTNRHSKSVFVDGKICTADYAAPTPAGLSQAVLDMEAAYKAAVARDSVDSTDLGSGNVDGLTLKAGLYTWGTDLKVANGVTLDGGPDAIWVFKVAKGLNVGNGAVISLTGGAQAKNVFWQVEGKASLGTKSDFKGIVICKGDIELAKGSIFNGRLLSQGSVKLDAATVTAP